MKALSYFPVLTIFALSLGTSNASAGGIRQSVPLEITHEGFLVVSVTVSDSIPARFILDTGAGIHAISASMFRRIGSLPAGHFTAFRHTGEALDLDLFRIRALSVSGIRQPEPVVAVLAILDSMKIDGILSLKLFQRQPFTLDLRDSLLTFETPNSLRRRLQVGQSCLLKLDDDRGKSLDAFVDAQLSDSLILECILDTGSPGSIFNARFLVPLGIDTTSTFVKRRTAKTLFGGVQNDYFADLRMLQIVGIPNSARSDMPVIFRRPMIYDGLLGIDFFKGRVVTLDIPDGRFILGPVGK